MPTVAVVFADGCEEVEGLSIVDVLRRLNIKTDMVGLDKLTIMGAHQIKLTCDKVLDDSLADYDLVALPGGSVGAENLRDSEQLKKLMVQRNEESKWNAAMCAAPIALARFGLLANSNYTSYPGIDQTTKAEAPTGIYHDKITVVDPQRKIITSRGPATAWAFAYEIAEAVGVDTSELKKAMLYDYLAEKIAK